VQSGKERATRPSNTIRCPIANIAMNNKNSVIKYQKFFFFLKINTCYLKTTYHSDANPDLLNSDPDPKPLRKKTGEKLKSKK
jgi:hypothetical protein